MKVVCIKDMYEDYTTIDNKNNHVLVLTSGEIYDVYESPLNDSPPLIYKVYLFEDDFGTSKSYLSYKDYFEPLEEMRQRKLNQIIT